MSSDPTFFLALAPLPFFFFLSSAEGGGLLRSMAASGPAGPLQSSTSSGITLLWATSCTRARTCKHTYQVSHAAMHRVFSGEFCRLRKGIALDCALCVAVKRINEQMWTVVSHCVQQTALCPYAFAQNVCPAIQNRLQSSPAGFEPTRLSAVDFKSTPLTTRAKRLKMPNKSFSGVCVSTTQLCDHAKPPSSN